LSSPRRLIRTDSPICVSRRWRTSKLDRHFSPAAYHDANADQPAFAIATEGADLAVDAFSQAKTLEIGRQTLIADIEKHGKQLSKVAPIIGLQIWRH